MLEGTVEGYAMCSIAPDTRTFNADGDTLPNGAPGLGQEVGNGRMNDQDRHEINVYRFGGRMAPQEYIRLFIPDVGILRDGPCLSPVHKHQGFAGNFESGISLGPGGMGASGKCEQENSYSECLHDLMIANENGRCQEF